MRTDRGVFRLLRLLTAWLAVGLFQLFHVDPTSTPVGLVIVGFIALLGVIIFASFGVLAEANALAKRLGEPYGSLILTLSVVVIEVILIAAVMLGPSPAPTIARDSIYSVMMIILNLVVGVAIVIGARRNGPQRFNPGGTRIYLVVITTLALATFLGPVVFRPYTGSFPTAAALLLAIVVGVGYAVFLVFQMGRGRNLFRAPHTGEVALTGHGRTDEKASPAKASPVDSLGARFLILVALLVAIALLAEHLATLIDFGVSELHLPIALGGVVIAAIVFTPETLTTLRAALNNEMQRVVNLCLGAFVSTVGLTVPSVLVIGVVTGNAVVFGLRGLDIALLLATLILLWVTYTRRRTTVPLGVAHLVLFAGFAGSVFIA